MRILLWHGWLLEGSGSNVATARVAEQLRAAGHDVLLVCQERHPERYPWIDAFGGGRRRRPVGADREPAASSARGGASCCARRSVHDPGLRRRSVRGVRRGPSVRRPVGGRARVLPADERRRAAGRRGVARDARSRSRVTRSRVRRSADARSGQGDTSRRSTAATSSTRCGSRSGTASWRAKGSRRRAPSSGHRRRARAVLGPRPGDRATWCRIVAPGVEVSAFRPRPRTEALRRRRDLLGADPDTARGRPSSIDILVERALDDRDAGALDALAETYDQAVPEPDAAQRLRALAGDERADRGVPRAS